MRIKSRFKTGIFCVPSYTLIRAKLASITWVKALDSARLIFAPRDQGKCLGFGIDAQIMGKSRYTR